MQCNKSRRIDLEGIRRNVLGGGHGAHGIVTALEDALYFLHNFNAVNIRGKVYFVDAYDTSYPQLTDKLDVFLTRLGKPLEFSRDWDIRLVPDERITTYKC
jgi:hypothetical protein